VRYETDHADADADADADPGAGTGPDRRIVALVGGIVAFVSGSLLIASMPIHRAGFAILVLAGLLPLASLGAALIHTRRHPGLDAAAGGSGHCCADCGYAIVDPAISRCPECGGGTVQSRAAASPARLRAWWRVGDVSAVLVAGGLVAGALSLSIQGPPDLPMAILLSLLLGGPIICLVLVPALLLQKAMHGRIGHGRTLIGLGVLAVSIMATAWPHRILWSVHRPGFERLHARTVAGETVPLPHPIGMFEVRRIESDPGGAIGYWTDPRTREGYIRLPDGVTKPPSFNRWSQVRLGSRWWSHVDD
jgi:hypothetical protein